MTEIKVKKKTLIISIVIIFILIVLFIFLNNKNSPSNEDITFTGDVGSNIGDIAPDFSLIDTEENSYSLSQFRGKKVVLAFFATWCTPCQIEANSLKQVDDETGGDKFIVYQIGVDNRENINDLKQFKSSFANNDWIIGFGFEVSQPYNVKTLDTTLIINEEGNIIYRDNGIPADIETLRGLLV